jgi:hypothetical protein
MLGEAMKVLTGQSIKSNHLNNFLTILKLPIMRVLFFLLFAVTAMAQQQDSVYCIQIMSTKNIDLVRAEHLTMAYDQAYVEQAGSYHRILIPYTSHDEAWFMLYTWKRAHKDAYITVRTKQQFEQYSKPFYTTR